MRASVGGLGATLLVLAVAGLAAQDPAPTSRAPVLPDGPGVDIVRARCLACHDSDLISSQRLGEAGWGREIDKMIRWGARVPDADRPALQAYLATHFGPQPTAAPAPAVEGQAVFDKACLACHGVDLVEAQRLSPAGWTREVDKMIRWGARVAEADRPALVSFLASRYPVR